MPECEREDGAIKVHQEPNAPAGPVRHLPKPLREESTTSPEVAVSREAAEGPVTASTQTRQPTKAKPRSRSTKSKQAARSSKRTARPRNSGSVTEDAQQRGEQHLDVTNGAQGHPTPGAGLADSVERAHPEQGLVDSGSWSKGSPPRSTLT